MHTLPSVLLLALAAGFSACKSNAPASFSTPEDALRELADTIGTGDTERAQRLLGEEGPAMLQSGDEILDMEDGLRVQQFIREKIAFEEQGPDTRIALLGNDGWRFPIPLVHADGTWSFDVEAGAEEVANLRVGRNELSTLASLHAFVDAQREYASEARDGQPRCFARKVFSSPGKHDGLYWPAADGQPESPFGPEIAAASSEGYTHKDGEGPQPYHGYHYRVLLEQGKNAPGGAKSYVDKDGRMTGGFALLAWPAKYGHSGIMTFQVNQRGIVYQRDLGDDTEGEAAKIKAFDPDGAWDPSGD
jgi:hypothetical protein